MLPRNVQVEKPELPPPLFDTISNVEMVLFVDFWVMVNNLGSPPLPI